MDKDLPPPTPIYENPRYEEKPPTSGGFGRTLYFNAATPPDGPKTRVRNVHKIRREKIDEIFK